MRIGIVSTMGQFRWGGSEELWAAMAREALAAQNSVAVASRRWPDPAKQVKDLEGLGCQLFPYPRARRWTSVRKKVPWLFHFVDLPFDGMQRLREWRPDVLCISEGGAYEAAQDPQLLRLLDSTRLPYVMVVQANSQDTTLSDPLRYAARAIYGAAHKVGFVAEENWRSAERQLAMSIAQGQILRNPVNQSAVGAIAYSTNTTTHFAMVARLHIPPKGHDIAFAALSTPQWTSRDWILNLYGDGPSRQYLSDLAVHFGITGRVAFHGHVGDVSSIWTANQLLLLPSRMEGTSLSLMEAMLCARPSVVTDVGGSADWVVDGEHGFVAPAPTVELLSEALERAWQARDSWERMGLRARERALTLHEPKPGRQLLELLKAAASTRPLLAP